ncbi:LOW QUALITY PROTEIN: mas-related G-protein coupled receptor member X2-like [Trichechus inunguis]
MEERGTSGGFLSMEPTIPAWGTKFTPMNGSDMVSPVTCDMKMLTRSLLVFVIVLGGLAGNAIVLSLLGFHLQRNAFSVCILNLAGADFLFLCCLIIDSLSKIITFFNSISIPYFFNTVICFAYITGLSILSAISIERCLSILCPTWYHCRRSRRSSVVTCALLWTLSLLLSILEGNYCGFLFNVFNNGWCQTSDFSITGWLIFLFVVLSGFSLALVVRMLCGSQQMQLTRLYVTILITVLVFLLCGLPSGI